MFNPMTRHWTALPNFVDCAAFFPAAERSAIRAQFGIPQDAFVVGCVAAVKKDHKRIDYFILEFHRWKEGKCIARETANPAKQCDDSSTFAPSRLRVNHNSSDNRFLLIAGAKTVETAELTALAESLLPGRYKILTNCSRDQMPDLYRAMDVFVLASLFEMMPIALLEALASGLPCLVNQHPVLEWMVGAGGGGGQLLSCQVEELLSESPKAILHSATHQLNNPTTGTSGGMAIDMSREGELARALAGLTPEWIASYGRQARAHALSMFSKDVVISKYVDYYRQVYEG